MIPFFVQFKCKLGQSYAVANALAEAEIASEIYSTAGHYDLLVKFYVDKETDIGHFVNERVQVIPGIQDTHTIITFKAFGGGCPALTGCLPARKAKKSERNEPQGEERNDHAHREAGLHGVGCNSAC